MDHRATRRGSSRAQLTGVHRNAFRSRWPKPVLGRATRDRVLVVAAIQMIAVVLLFEKVPFAVPLAIAGGVVHAGLCCRVAFLEIAQAG